MMAEKKISKVSKKVEDHITCAVCLEQYTDPRTLPCLHSFCTKCIELLPADPKGDDIYCFPCPSCRIPTIIPQHGVTGFPIAFHLNSIVEVHELMKRVQITEENLKAFCDSCKSKDAIGYCSECDKFLCPACENAHKQWGPTSTHKPLVSIDDVSNKKTASELVSMRPAPTPNCPNHSKPLDLYCVTCEQPICYHCTIKDHKGHDHDLINDAYEESKKELISKNEQLQEKIEKMIEKKEILQAAIANIDVVEVEAEIEIKKGFEALYSGLAAAQKTILHNLKTARDHKKSFEKAQKNIIETHLDALLHCKAHSENCLGVSTSTSAQQLLVTAKKQIVNQADKLLASTECDSIEPKEEVNDLKDPFQGEDIQKLSQSLESELSSAFGASYSDEFYQHSHCQIIPNLPTDVYKSEECSGTLKIAFQGESVVVNVNDIKCLFVDDQSSLVEIECEVELNGADMVHNLKFTPDEAGHYTFYLQLNGKEINFDTSHKLRVNN